MDSSIKPKEILEFTKELASEAGSIIISYFQGRFGVESKDSAPNGIDIVTDADKESERFILSQIRKSFPSHDIMTEETSLERSGSRFLWVVDPLDGTVNFSHSYPQFCVSIALMEHGAIKLGVVFDPVRQEMFWASDGEGAYLSGSPVRVTQSDNLYRCIVGTGFPYDKARSMTNNLREFCAVTLKTQGIRRSGSAALDLAWVACGRLDGFWELKLKPWDFTAGMLLVQEAGGKVTNRRGRKMKISSQSIVATNSFIHSELLDILSSVE
jgi:myo-inositol-1(or 4)-monophosphatase